MRDSLLGDEEDELCGISVEGAHKARTLLDLGTAIKTAVKMALGDQVILYHIQKLQCTTALHDFILSVTCIMLYSISVTQCYTMLQCYTVLHNVTVLHGVTQCYTVLHNVTVLHGVTQCYTVLGSLPSLRWRR